MSINNDDFWGDIISETNKSSADNIIHLVAAILDVSIQKTLFTAWKGFGNAVDHVSKMRNMNIPCGIVAYNMDTLYPNGVPETINCVWVLKKTPKIMKETQDIYNDNSCVIFRKTFEKTKEYRRKLREKWNSLSDDQFNSIVICLQLHVQPTQSTDHYKDRDDQDDDDSLDDETFASVFPDYF